MKKLIPLTLVAAVLWQTAFALAGESAKPAAPASPEIQAPDRVYYLQIRVVFAGTTGIFGNVVQELADMRDILTQHFSYPAYELSNTIRLSLFGNEEATALVFPEHYLRVIPKGSTKGNRLKVKVELYHVAEGSETRTRVEIGEPSKRVQFQEKGQEGSHSTIFPIAGSAMILTPRQWDAFGGVPVRVNTQGRVSSNTLSSSPIAQPGVNASPGVQKYLILGIALEEVRM